ncbi:YggS family pyridoxal phosphate-dependent enzyme [Quadrisphaera sp. KR29]|uniref:YggS family pyridoxal phosphate-dependent enzyme n=1 Tax=Quadrisphaera sp. KR29 TaxID=3461391 RepID=UPI004043F038
MSEDGAGAGSPGRAAELAEGLRAVRQRVADAEAAAGRAAGSVLLVVVTKTFPASDVRLLAASGAGDVGESREPEAGLKAAACADLGLRWHQVGQVQTNKAAAVAAWADVVHSVDRPRLVAALERGHRRALEEGARPEGHVLDVLVQVDLADDDERDPGRGGAAPRDVAGLADAVAAAGGLRLAGVMAVAPAGVDPRGPFERLAQVAARVRAQHPGADAVSAGMSGDLEAAVAAGATHVRVGRAVLGARPPIV